MRKMAAMIFPGFQTLDHFGPIEMLAGFRDEIELVTLAPTMDPVLSRHGQRILPDITMAESATSELLFIPGGDCALEFAKHAEVMDWVRDVAEGADHDPFAKGAGLA